MNKGPSLLVVIRVKLGESLKWHSFPKKHFQHFVSQVLVSLAGWFASDHDVIYILEFLKQPCHTVTFWG